MIVTIFPDTVIIGLGIEMSIVVLNALYKYRLLLLLLFYYDFWKYIGHQEYLKTCNFGSWFLNFILIKEGISNGHNFAPKGGGNLEN